MWRAGLETCDTADLEICATGEALRFDMKGRRTILFKVNLVLPGSD
jgi:hypothetical protein